MSHSLAINNREYIPAGEVGKHFGYTRDYILTLAREGKIDGQKIGHRWYVNLESAKTFFESAKTERELRRQFVSEVRKAELKSHSENRVRPLKTTALVETMAIVVIGLLLGVSGYAGTTVHQKAALSDIQTSFFKELAISFYEFVTPPARHEVSTVAESPVPQSVEVGVESAPSVMMTNQVSTTTHTSLVVGTNEVLTTTTIESIRDSFSDEVSVSMDPHNPDSGIIIPHFKNTDGEAYRFLIVPVTPDENN